MPNALAFSALLPASAPTMTADVFLETDSATLPPSAVIAAVASSRVIDAKVPLARRFVDFFARQARRPPPELADATVRLLQAWTWPGNVRERCTKNAVGPC